MDSRARIDYALFNITPTRTRCDLVIFGNGQSEKLASGLLQPFLMHLKCVKEQIEKGGYSITLTPPAPSAWFTKGTLQRFVRFVSSPDVLERFVTIEKEIEHIEESIRSNELACAEVDANGKELSADKIHRKTTSAAEINDDSEGIHRVANEEHSRVQLQRVLETRKAVLHKEQAMAYARALVAGFQTNHLAPLVSFSNTFGASRLREACYNFVKLCNKKNQDRRWIVEVAAMQASSPSQLSYSETSGIVLADDENGKCLQHLAASDQVEVNGNGKPQASSSWSNNYPQYYPNYYGPIHPHNMLPYQGYPFPGMHFGNPYTVADTVNDRKSSDGRKKSSPREKEKSSKEKLPDTTEEEEFSESASEESADGGKKNSWKKKSKRKNGKKSSKRVVIRNINYISSKKDEDNEESSSDDEDLFDGDSIKQQIEEAVGSLRKHRRQKKQLDSKHSGAVNGSLHTRETEGGKVTESWSAFQNILMRDQETNTNALNRGQMENDIFTANNSAGRNLSREQIAGSDSIGIGNQSRVCTENFTDGDNFRACVKNSSDTDDNLMLSRGNEDQGNFIRTTQSEYAARSAIVNGKSREDWFVTHKNGSLFPDHPKVFEGEYASIKSSSARMEKAKNDIVDDSFMVQAQDHQYGSQFKTDLSMALDVTKAAHQRTDASENPQSKRESSGTFEPDDLYMVLDRSSSHEPFSASWTPVIDYENIIKVSETDKNQSAVEPKVEDVETAKVIGNGAPRPKALGGPLGKSKSEILSKCRKPAPANRTIARKTKHDLEEERRLRMEELLIQRQKRIAERKSSSVTSAASNKETASIKKSVKSVKVKPPLKSVVQEKNVITKSSTIIRLATAQISKQVSVAQCKTIQTNKARPKATGAIRKSVGNVTKKPAKEMEKHLDKKISVENRNVALTSKSHVSENLDTAEISTPPEVKIVSSPASVPTVDTKGKNLDDSEILVSDNSDTKGSLVLKAEVTSFPLDEITEKVVLRTEVDISTDMIAAEENNTSESEQSHLKALNQEQCSTEKATDAVVISTSNAKDSSESVAPNTKQPKVTSVTFSTTPKVSEIPAASTPPSRKKWDNNDYYSSNSEKVAKGFKRFLMFGRKGRPISYA